MTLEFMDSVQSKPKLLTDGYLYVKDKTVDDTRVYWRCELYHKIKCRARAVTDGDTVKLNGTHCHDSDASRLEALKVKELIRHRASTSKDTPKNIITEACAGVSDPIAKRIAASASVARTINRIRQKGQTKPFDQTTSSDVVNTKNTADKVDSFEPSREGVLKLLEEALAVRTEDGGVYLSAKDVKKIEAFLQKQNALLDKAVEEGIVKVEVSVEDTIVTGLEDTDEMFVEEDYNDPTLEVEINKGKRAYSTETSSLDESTFSDKQHSKRTKMAVLSDSNFEDTEKNIQKKTDVKSAEEKLNLFHVLKEIVKTKYTENEAYYIPPRTVKLIETFLNNHDNIMFTSEV